MAVLVEEAAPDTEVGAVVVEGLAPVTEVVPVGVNEPAPVTEVVAEVVEESELDPEINCIKNIKLLDLI